MVSVIIPIYNVEKYLRKSLDSISKQTYQDLEVILVNDGSTDTSSSICQHYVENDDRFNLFNKENGGVSSARNMGLNLASGDYILFIDPDDWLEPSMIQTLFESITKYNADISICGYSKEDGIGNSLYSTIENKFYKYNKIDCLNKILDQDGFRGYLWNKLFSIKVLRGGERVYFDEQIHFSEDLLFTCEAILKAETIVYETKPEYHYIIHGNNASHNQYSPRKLTSLKALDKIIDLLSFQEGINLKVFKTYYSNLNISLLLNGIHQNKIEKSTYKELKKNLYQYPLRDISNITVKLSNLIARINIKMLYKIWKRNENLS